MPDFPRNKKLRCTTIQNQSCETNYQMHLFMEFTHKAVWAIIINILHITNRIEEEMNMMLRKLEYLNGTQGKHWETANEIPRIRKYALYNQQQVVHHRKILVVLDSNRICLREREKQEDRTSRSMTHRTATHDSSNIYLGCW